MWGTPAQTRQSLACHAIKIKTTFTHRLGAFCESPGQSYNGQSCEADHSTCGGTVQDCHGRFVDYTRVLSRFNSFTSLHSGPGFRISDFESNRIIGEKQFEGAQKIMNGALSTVHGTVKSVHTYVSMANHSFVLPNGTTVSTCPPAMGRVFLCPYLRWRELIILE